MNPTAMWFAQMGAQQPSEEEMMMMQQSQGQAPMQGMPPQQPSQEEMAMMQQGQQQGPSEEDLMGVMQVLQETMESGENPQEVVAQLLQSQVPPEIIIQSLIQIGAPLRRRAPILEGIDEGTYFYFVHSYYVVPKDESVVAIETDYHQPFCAAVWQDNVYATQFHPEKSQSDGLKLLKNFAELG